MDATLVTAIAALVSAVAGAWGNSVVAARRARREADRADRTGDDQAAAALRDAILERIHELRGEVSRQRGEIKSLQDDTAACERRSRRQAEEIARLRIALRAAGIEIAELPLDGGAE